MSKKYNFDIALSPDPSTYSGELALPYVTAAVTGAETIANNRCRLIEGVVHKAVIEDLSFAAGLIQDAATCAFGDGESLTLTEQVLTLADLKVNEEICRGTIFPTYVGAQGRMRRNGQIPPDFAEFLLASTAAKAATDVETLMWGGASPFGVGLLSDDGTFDITGVRASAMGGFAEFDLTGITTGPVLTAANILEALDGVFATAAATPGILNRPGCGFYVSYEAYAFFQQAIADKGTEGNYNKDLKSVTYLGYPVYPTAGIPNTVDIIAFTYPENIVVGTNAYTGNESASLIPVYQYDGSDNVRVTMNFGVGVQVAVAADGVVGFDFTA